MSEYQYYEFQTIDRPLTEDEQAAISELSSRVALTPTQAIFTYQYGDFRGDEQQVLARYFDALLYLANWGTQRLMFRFPKALIDLEAVTAYCIEDNITVETIGDQVILDIQFNDEEGLGWVEGEGWLSRLIGLRAELLRRDYRGLYIAWLKASVNIEVDEADEELEEPPVPLGLRTLSPALRAFVELFEVDPQLLKVAAQASGAAALPADAALRAAIGKLTRAERDDYVLRLARDEPHLALKLHARLREVSGAADGPPPPRRTAAQLLAQAEQEHERVRQEQAQAAEAKRIAEIEALARRGSQAWQEVDALIQKFTAKGYAEAAQLLLKLREVAVYEQTEAAFQVRVHAIGAQYKRRPSLLAQLRQAGLLS